MAECVLHVGFGKTGTSALQTHLSRHPELGTPRGHHYVVVDGAGAVVAGDQVRARAAGGSFPYVASVPDLWGRDDLEAIGGKLQAVGRRGVPVLSQEDWGRTGRRCADERALERMGVQAHVVAYVRPQIEWFNSGWWQWWTWQEQFDTPADVLEKWRTRFLWWRRQLDRWAGNPNVSRLTVRLYRRNTIPDFLQLMGADGEVPAGDNVVNASLAPLHIQILKSVSHLRGPHNPQFDWVLQQCLPSAESAPWALEPRIMQAIVDGCRQDNERLLELLSPEDADEMRRDQRWWSSEPYRDRAVATDDELQATPAELVRAVEALLRMAAGVRR